MRRGHPNAARTFGVRRSGSQRRPGSAIYRADGEARFSANTESKSKETRRQTKDKNMDAGACCLVAPLVLPFVRETVPSAPPPQTEG